MARIKKATPNNIGQIYTWFYNPVVFFLCDPKLVYPMAEGDWFRLIKTRDFYLIHDKYGVKGCIGVDHLNYISCLYVVKNQRNKGYAKQLVEFASANRPAKVLLHENQREHQQLFRNLGFLQSDISEEFRFETHPQLFNMYHRSQL